MNIQTMMLIIELISKGVGVSDQIMKLAIRCKDGEEILESEILMVSELLEAEVASFLAEDVP